MAKKNFKKNFKTKFLILKRIMKQDLTDHLDCHRDSQNSRRNVHILHLYYIYNFEFIFLYFKMVRRRKHCGADLARIGFDISHGGDFVGVENF